MKPPSVKFVTSGIFALFLVMLVAIGAPNGRQTTQISGMGDPAPPTSASGPGITLYSSRIDLPLETTVFADGPNATVINTDCTGCHSPEMVSTQPRLTQEQWRATIDKMRQVYKAPVAERDIPEILKYLQAMPAQQAR